MDEFITKLEAAIASIEGIVSAEVKVVFDALLEEMKAAHAAQQGAGGVAAGQGASQEAQDGGEGAGTGTDGQSANNTAGQDQLANTAGGDAGQGDDQGQ